MLFTKCILAEPEESDGVRVSVMSRHTQNDGKTPDLRIKHFHAHVPLLGPSPKLIGDYYLRSLPWVEFEERYVDEIRTGMKSELVHTLATIAVTRDVTLLCIEETCEHCHRRLLAQECAQYFPELSITHR